MNTAARIQPTNGAHWYDPATGQAMHTVIAKGNGLPRPTTLADARKLGLLPSVNTVLRVLDKPALNSWKVEQAVLAALTTPRIEGEDLDAFVSRVLSVDAEAEAQKARDFGILIHAQIEGALNGVPVLREAEPFVNPVLAVLKDFGRVVATERIVFGKGYAGTLDMLCIAAVGPVYPGDLIIADLKTTKAKVLPKEAYPEHQLQLAAYAAALGNTAEQRIRTINVYVSSVRPGEISVCENTNWVGTYEDGFLPILNYWKWANRF